VRTRHGFTLVEVLLAVILIDVGLLALVAASGVVVRQMNALRLRNAALRAATNRLQQLGVGACVASAGSTATPDGIREDWSSASWDGQTRDLRDSVTFAAGGTTHTIVLRTKLPC